MNSNKVFFLASLAIFSGLFCVLSASAEVNPQVQTDSLSKEWRAYRNLRDVKVQKPAQQPKLLNGIDELTQRKHKYVEKLPIQLKGAVEEVSSRRYISKLRRVRS